MEGEDAGRVVVEREVGVGAASTGRGDSADDDLDALRRERVECGGGHLVVDERADDAVDLFVAGHLETVGDRRRVELAVADLDLGAGGAERLAHADSHGVDDRDLVAEGDEGELLAGEVDRLGDLRGAGPRGLLGPSGHGVLGLLDALDAGGGRGGVRGGRLLAGATRADEGDGEDARRERREGTGPVGITRH